MTGPRRPGEESPIFIGGLANSGKTPLRRVLEAHPEMAFTRRTYLWTRYYETCGNLSDDRNLDRLFESMLDDPGVQSLGPDVARIRAEFRQGLPTYTRLFALLHCHHARRMGRRRWGDQLGLVEAFADAIFTDFPSAKMIHLVRDPRTRTKGTRAGKLGWETARWRRSAELAIRNQKFFRNGYLVMRYECFADDSRQALQEVCRFIGEDVHPAMLEVLGGIDFEQSYADTAAARLVQPYTRDVMEDLGYAVESGSARSGGRMQRTIGRVSTWAGNTAWHVTVGRRSPGYSSDQS